MEDNFIPNTFSLQVDTGNIPYLNEAAKWAKFLSIMGFIFCGLMLIVALSSGAFFSSYLNQVETGSPESNLLSISGGFIAIIYIVLAIMCFISSFFLFRFASKMQVALRNNDQVNLNTSFSNLKSYFKFWGIFMIIFLCIYALVIIFIILGGAFMR